MAKTRYEYNKKWRLKNPKKRGKGVERYYNRHKYTRMRYIKYSSADVKVIVTKMINGNRYTDPEIAILLGRSLRSIQMKRAHLKSGR